MLWEVGQPPRPSHVGEGQLLERERVEAVCAQDRWAAGRAVGAGSPPALACHLGPAQWAMESASSGRGKQALHD